MKTQTVTVHIPEALYGRLEEQAGRRNRSIESELLDVLASAMPDGDGLPVAIDEELGPLDEADDATIERAARSHLAPELSIRIEELHWKQQAQGLTPEEARTLSVLMDQYERILLIRAQAAAIWKRRGHDPSELLVTR